MKTTSFQKNLTRSVVVVLLLALGFLFFSFRYQNNQPLADNKTQIENSSIKEPSQTPVHTENLTPTNNLDAALAISATNTEPISPTSSLATPTALATIPLSNKPLKFFTYEIINVYPHDAQAFTQGLIYKSGLLYEGTGLQGRSSLRKVELESGRILDQVNLASDYFGEGITLFDNRIIQLTWQNQRGFIWSIDNTFTPIKDYHYTTEGWGITHDGTQLIMSDGTENLYFWDSAIMTNDASEPTLLKTLPVSDNGEPVVRLNELEYINDEIYANIWQTDRIARISPQTGDVTGWIDLAGLLTPQERANSDVLNGIAYDAEEDRLFVTGKLWPKLFEIKLVPADDRR